MTGQASDAGWLVGDDRDDADRRACERRRVNFYVRVRSASGTPLAGDVIDISFGGLKLMTEQPVPLEARYHLWLEASLESGRRARAELEARCIWSRRDDAGAFYGSGLQFSNLPPRAFALVRMIVEELGSTVA